MVFSRRTAATGLRSAPKPRSNCSQADREAGDDADSEDARVNWRRAPTLPGLTRQEFAGPATSPGM